MKKNTTILAVLFMSGIAYSQVGINTDAPQATLDVVATPADLTKTDGLIAPRIKGSELKLKDANYGIPQTGAIIYVTEALAPIDTTAKTINVTTLGYFYFDGNLWQKMTTAATVYTEPWNVAGTADPATLNTQDIYQTGSVAIGKNLPETGVALDVKGAVRFGDFHNATAGANSAIIGGSGNEASTDNSIAGGSNNRSRGISSVALGASNTASGNSSFALGLSNQSNATGSFAMGFGNITSSQYEIAVGRWNAITTGGSSSVFVTTDPAFQISASVLSSAKFNAMTVLKNGHTAIGVTGAEATAKPTELLDLGGAATAGNGGLRIRNINSSAYTGSTTDRVVVADASGILKTVNPGTYTLFHARLANNQTHTSGISTLLFAAPLATSALYTYDVTTGILTFNQPGNYLVNMQASFTNTAQYTQLLLGIRPVPDANYLARGSHYSPVATSGTVGELMNYNTMIIVPSAGYQIRFTVGNAGSCTILSTETGSTGSGNVTNVTIQKI